MRVPEFVWPQDRIDHIARHGVTPEEVEEACFGRALVQRARSQGQSPVFYVLGRTIPILRRDSAPGREGLPGHGATHDGPREASLQETEEIVKTQKLPQTDSIQELAQFWDTHDLADFEEELEEVAEPVFERATTVTLRLESAEAVAVKRIAESKGLTDTNLIRQWVLERIASS